MSTEPERPGAGPASSHKEDEDVRSVPRRSPLFVLELTVRRFGEEGVTDLAAALTYHAVLSIFPGLIALLSLVGVLGRGDSPVDTILEILRPLVSSNVTTQLQHSLEEIASSQAAGLALVTGLLGALWSASGYVGAFGRAMNKIYDIQEGRSFLRRRPAQLLVTLITLMLCAVALVIVIVSGPLARSVGSALGMGDGLVTVWGIAKWPVLLVAVMMAVAVLYWATPNVAFPRFRVISVGAFVAIMVWLIGSIGFAFYVTGFSSYNKTYGSVAGFVIALLWLWITNLALLFGAQLDAELERGRELRLGIAAEETLQLPLRDERGVEKRAARKAAAVANMRQIRVAAAGSGGGPTDRPFGRGSRTR